MIEEGKRRHWARNVESGRGNKTESEICKNELFLVSRN